MSLAGSGREVRYHPKQKRRERHLRNGKEARDLSSSRQETPEAVKKVRRAHLGNAFVLGLKAPMS